MTKPIIKKVSNIVYAIGVLCVVCLLLSVIFAWDYTPNDDAMLSMGGAAYVCLCVGMNPMLLACGAVYMSNSIKDSKHKKRNFILVFLPGFICAICFLVMMGNMLYSQISWRL